MCVMILNYLDKKSMYIGRYKTPNKVLSCLDKFAWTSEGLLCFYFLLSWNPTDWPGAKRLTSSNAAIFHWVTGLEDSVIVGNKKNHLTSLGNWLAPVATGVYSRWKRCWRASVDGWASSTFHSRCDGKGPTVTIIRVGRYIFGGYTNRSWGE